MSEHGGPKMPNNPNSRPYVCPVFKWHLITGPEFAQSDKS